MALDAQHSRKLLEDSEQGESTLTFVFLKTCSLPHPLLSSPCSSVLFSLHPLLSPPLHLEKNKCPSGLMDPKVPATDKRGGHAQGWGGIGGITRMDTWGWNAQVVLGRWAAGLVCGA